MKAITLTQPWAQLVAIGAKCIETRSWGTIYRGPLAIHAAKTLSAIGGKKAYQELCSTEPFYSVLQAYGEEYIRKPRGLKALVEDPLMPMGYVVAIGRLVDCVDSAWALRNIAGAKEEEAFGDYTPGRFAWILRNVRKLDRPVLAKGSLGLWDWLE